MILKLNIKYKHDNCSKEKVWRTHLSFINQSFIFSFYDDFNIFNIFLTFNLFPHFHQLTWTKDSVLWVCWIIIFISFFTNLLVACICSIFNYFLPLIDSLFFLEKMCSIYENLFRTFWSYDQIDQSTLLSTLLISISYRNCAYLKLIKSHWH